MYKLIFRPRAEKDLKKLPANVQLQIIQKLKYFLSAPNPLNFASYLKDTDLGTYRFRVGNYRVIFDIEDNTIKILTLGNRKDIYK